MLLRNVGLVILVVVQVGCSMGYKATIPVDHKSCRRRTLLSKTLATIFFGTTSAVVVSSSSPGGGVAWAAETVGKDPECNDASCLGVWDGLLADCPHNNLNVLKKGAGCVSSQDDTPGIFSEPWDYAELSSLDWEYQSRQLLPAIQLVTSKNGDKVDVLVKNGRYLRVLFTDGKTGEKSVGEFYFTENDTTVQFRVGSLIEKNSNVLSSSLSNQARCEAIRKQLRYLKVPVLRNRRRAFFFAESDDLDSFGPSGSSVLGPPEEMTAEELGERYSPSSQRFDYSQKFPLVGN